jgi:hypothetical protein
MFKAPLFQRNRPEDSCFSIAFPNLVAGLFYSPDLFPVAEKLHLFYPGGEEVVGQAMLRLVVTSGQSLFAENRRLNAMPVNTGNSYR